MFRSNPASCPPRNILFMVVLSFSLISLCSDGPAADKTADVKTTFASVLETKNRAALEAVGEYIKANPQAADVEEAYQWLFTTAAAHGLEGEVLAAAEAYLKRTGDKLLSRSQAQRVVGVGHARAGKMSAAMGAFAQHLEDVDVRNPDAGLDLGILLAEHAQLQGDIAAAREIYDALSSRLFLNSFVREFCELRVRHLELAKQKAPAIGTKDLDGKAIDLKDLEGKVVLVDFWATNCEPCLRQFPAMKKLYDEYHDKGFEIVGVSLDDSASTVNAFQGDFKLPWRLSLSKTDGEVTRRRYRADKVPTMYLIDQKGTIAYVDLHDEQIREGVEKLLGVGK